MKRWYVVETLGVECDRYGSRARCDREAAKRLCELLGEGEAFAPLRPQEVRLGNGARSVKLEPMFPGYAFAHFAWGADGRARWGDDIVAAIRRTRFLRALVAPSPACAVPDKLIATIALAQRVVQRRGEGFAHFKAGDLVRIREQAFAGHVGELMRLDATGRCTVLLSMMGARVPVTGDAADLALEHA